MFLQLFRYLYDLISMHLSIHKAYYETLVAKIEQFTQYFSSVKKSKQELHFGANQQTFREVYAYEKIERAKRSIEDKQQTILIKRKEIRELKDDLYILEAQIHDVKQSKRMRLKKIIDDFNAITHSDFMSMVKEHSNQEPKIQALLDIVQILITHEEEAEMTKDDQIDWFINKPDYFVE